MNQRGVAVFESDDESDTHRPPMKCRPGVWRRPVRIGQTVLENVPSA